MDSVSFYEIVLCLTRIDTVCMIANSKILVVDDEEAILMVLKMVLEKENFHILTAIDVLQAQQLLTLHEFVAVITDVKMPGAGGLELLSYIQNHFPKIPVILMTGFAKIVESKTAFELGAKAFLAKPFDRGELLSAVKTVTQVQGPDEVDEGIEAVGADSYCRIGIDQFVAGKTIQFEIFVCLSGDKYIKIAHTGENIDMERIHAFKSKGVNFLYIKKTDFARYVGFNLTLSNAAKDSRMISREKKIQMLRHASAVILENLFINGVTQQDFDQARAVTETSLALLAESNDGFQLLSALREGGDPLYTHSLGVSLFSVLIAKQTGWSSPSSLFKVSTAGLFHDIGLKEIDRAIVDKPRMDLSVPEVRLLETHCVRGAAILSSIPSMSEEIIQAVLQHHESADGRGYPSNLFAHKITPMARLLSIADQFCRLALAEAMPVQQAVDRLSLTIVSPSDLPFLSALKASLGLSEAKVPPFRTGA